MIPQCDQCDHNFLPEMMHKCINLGRKFGETHDKAWWRKAKKLQLKMGQPNYSHAVLRRLFWTYPNHAESYRCLIRVCTGNFSNVGSNLQLVEAASFVEE